MNFLEITAYIGHFILFINLLIYSKGYRYNKSVAFKVFIFYLIITLAIQLISTYLRSFKIPNLYLSHYYFIGQFILFSLFFKQLLKKKLHKKGITLCLIIVLTVLGIYYFLYPSNYYKFNVFEIIITSIPLIIYSIFFFVQKIEDADKKYIYIVSGFFLYILCSTLLFTTGNITAEIKKIIWEINSLLYVTFQVLIFVEWYKNFRKKTLVSFQQRDKGVTRNHTF